MTQPSQQGRGLDEQAVLLVAGLADLAFGAIGSATDTLRSLLRRSDAADLVQDAEQDLVARGRLVLDRYTAQPAHLEVLAQHILARSAASAATGGDD
ncbi:polyprenyl synthetase [Streptomyces sp. SID10815]|uniref:polyprenyl synthetase n=1 Tax=Streptomyces sp. SID10815 TaxID=2706027 RepID=UPI0013C5ACE3|nr:polyprenyl synthetase [Streptomyces sp. SID10815]NEA45312.1 polyprenyl synthetase [Streptomyces sp. SID10815]